MRNTASDLCTLIRALAAVTHRSPSTISRLVTGSGDTLIRLERRRADGAPAHRITTERAERALSAISNLWPADARWPDEIPRPDAKKLRRAS